MLRLPIDDLEDSFEQLWTKQHANDLFEILCVPFFLYDLALGDLIRADPQNDRLQAVESRSGNGVLRVAVVKDADVEALHPLLHDIVGPTDYLYEWYHPGYLAVNLAPGRSHDRLVKALSAFGTKVQTDRFLG